MTNTSMLPASPPARYATGPSSADPGGQLPVADDLVIEDLFADPWPAPAPGICICTISVG